MDERERIERESVIAEAKTWLGTPYMLNAKVKGAGVDCGTFLIASFSGAGVIPDVDLGVMMEDFNLHRNDEIYLKWILEFCRRVEVAQPGDIILYQFGRIISHGALVVSYPKIIHAPPQGVIYASAQDPGLAARQVGIYSLKTWGGVTE